MIILRAGPGDGFLGQGTEVRKKKRGEKIFQKGRRDPTKQTDREEAWGRLVRNFAEIKRRKKSEPRREGEEEGTWRVMKQIRLTKVAPKQGIEQISPLYASESVRLILGKREGGEKGVPRPK